MMAAHAEKRKIDEAENEEEDDEWIGPMPSEAAKPKKKKGELMLWILGKKDLNFQGRIIRSLIIAQDISLERQATGLVHYKNILQDCGVVVHYKKVGFFWVGK